MPSSATVIETQRLILRPPEIGHFEDLYSMWSDPEVVGHVTGHPLTREDTWARLLRSVGHWAALGFGHWVVFEKLNGTFVGEVGFVRHMRGISDDFDRALEIGWMLARRAQRLGYASEAVAAALGWADESWPQTDTVCIISPNNVASLKLASKFAYQAEYEALYKDKPVLVCRRSTNLHL
ncbi:GNAT family N-acetyltransferase [Paraburkholderia sp. J12]|uniref:GNAT family N-acetyltransferase n=1 Tax=Paraburkholderia sp. J12 TaxID=2805432 RepID=UPI002ABDE100|nr:GNAT family N-acetyltransferase [Paraburkholderia sp. J12]